MSVNVWRDNGGVALPYVKGNFSELKAATVDIGSIVVDTLEVNLLTVNDEVDADTVNVTGQLQFDAVSGTSGQFVKKGSGGPGWANIVVGDVTHGTANQVMVTNGGATASVWSSSLTLSSLSFSTDVNQTALSYYSAPASTVGLTVTYEDGSSTVVLAKFERIGNVVCCSIPAMSVTYAVLTYVLRYITGIPTQYRPTYGVDVSNYYDCYGTTVPCKQVNNVGPVTTYCSGSVYVTENGEIFMYTNVNRTAPAAGSLTSYPMSLCYSIV